MEQEKKHRIRKIIKFIVIVLIILVVIFAIINLFSNNYIRDAIIKGQKPRKY